jgi:hypothetical protein
LTYIEIKPYVGQNCEIIIYHGIQKKRFFVRRGVVLGVVAHSVILRTHWSKHNICVRRPILDRDSIRILEQEACDEKKM